MDGFTATADTQAHWRRRFGVTPAIEFAVLAAAIAIAIVSYFVISGEASPQRLLTPPLVALLLIANLVPGVALLVLMGRRIAKKRAARSPIGGSGRLHVRLVALFSVLASVPTLFVALFASLLFQYGVEFWFSDRARSMLENASMLARENYQAELARVNRQTLTMRQDLNYYLETMPPDSKKFAAGLAYQVYQRELSEALLLKVTPQNGVQSLALVNPYERNLESVVTPAMIEALRQGKDSVVVRSPDRIGVLTVFDPKDETYLYAARVFEPELAAQLKRGETVLADYQTLRERSRRLQLQFNAALLVLSLLIVGIAVFVALAVADRLVRPVGDLVGAARRIASGDLDARVAPAASRDEIATLGDAFNQMTERLQEQTNALVSANAQLESRRALIEAVMEGVTAGVISVGADRHVRLINNSAIAMLKAETENPVGRLLDQIAPELAEVLYTGAREVVAQVNVAGETRTLAVKVTRDEGGQILTFDDITQQLLDQRRAAWSDVARRIAHEIKNPLTPIQLAAERLQRRYGKSIDAEDGVFQRLTDTIVRQVGDLRRMVDEFSSFARMPKPVFREESIVDIARQTLFLHEVAHPGIHFALDHGAEMPSLVCDRRQIGQALTNLVKNAVEAIEARPNGAEQGRVDLKVSQPDDRHLVITLDDNGVGLPVERDRIVEPYMTTRARGTGLGLAIVKKIVEEHFGTITFGDRPGGGTRIVLNFEAATLAALAAQGDAGTDIPSEDRPPILTRTGNQP